MSRTGEPDTRKSEARTSGTGKTKAGTSVKKKSGTKGSKKRKKNRAVSGQIKIILVACVVIIIALIVTVVLLLNKNNKEDNVQQESTQEIRNVVTTEDDVEEIITEMAEPETVDPGYFTVHMTNEWHFTDGLSASYDAVVGNLEENTNDVYFDVVLSSDEEHIIYKSDVIPRGGEINSITLDEDLDAGSYDCVVIYHLVDDKQNTLSELRVGITVVVES